MELKYKLEVSIRINFQVLIAPLWNWNIIVDAHIGIKASSNRTFMELKCSLALPKEPKASVF